MGSPRQPSPPGGWSTDEVYCPVCDSPVYSSGPSRHRSHDRFAVKVAYLILILTRRGMPWL